MSDHNQLAEVSEDRQWNETPDDSRSIGSNQCRQCWVCFGTESDDYDEAIWLSPCQCKGTMKWVHEDCLQRWIDEKQERTNSHRVSCSQCNTHYIMCFPPVNYLVKLIEQYDRLLYGSSPFVAVSIVVGSIYWCCGSFGYISIIQVMGYEEGKNMVEELDPLVLVIGLPIIPVALILAKMIKWEDYVLRLWRQNTFKLPRPFSFLIENPPTGRRANCEQILRDPEFNEPLGCTRMVCGALLLPTVSALVGKIFFSTFTDSQWRQSLLGGLAFLLFKGAMKIYFRKSQYVRYSQRTIRNNNYGKGGQPSGSNEPLNNLSNVPSPFPSSSNVDSEIDDDQRDESQPRLRRRMFSMTIRL